jgi:hypothetical protein
MVLVLGFQIIGEIHTAQAIGISQELHTQEWDIREHSALWRPTSKIKVKKRCFNKNMYKENYFDNKRLCFSHEILATFIKT